MAAAKKAPSFPPPEDQPPAIPRHTPGLRRQEHGDIQAQRVEYIRNKMAALKWVRGFSDVEAATAWGMSISAVQHLACEASRQLRAILNLDGEFVERVESRLEQIMEIASNKRELRTAVEAARVLLGERRMRKSGGQVPPGTPRFVVELSTPERPKPDGGTT